MLNIKKTTSAKSSDVNKTSIHTRALAASVPHRKHQPMAGCMQDQAIASCIAHLRFYKVFSRCQLSIAYPAHPTRWLNECHASSFQCSMSRGWCQQWTLHLQVCHVLTGDVLLDFLIFPRSGPFHFHLDGLASPRAPNAALHKQSHIRLPKYLAGHVFGKVETGESACGQLQQQSRIQATVTSAARFRGLGKPALTAAGPESSHLSGGRQPVFVVIRLRGHHHFSKLLLAGALIVEH